jgi:hypothetical protein
MVDTAIHLEQRVLPPVPIRHWICSLPWGLRALLGYDRHLCSAVLTAFVTEMSASLRRRAKKLLGLRSVSDALTGAVAATQRTDSALRLNVHYHVLALDGVYVRDESGTLTFHALPTPTHEEVALVAARTAARVERLLQTRGRTLEDDGDEQPVRRNRWGWLLKRVFRAEVDRCPKCDGPMRWVEAARTREAAADLLGRLGLAPRPPPAAPLPPLGQLTLGFRSDS